MPNRLTGAVLAANPNMKLNETPREALARVIGKDLGPWHPEYAWTPTQGGTKTYLAFSGIPGNPQCLPMQIFQAAERGGLDALLIFAAGCN